MSTGNVAGSMVCVLRYPVKSIMGEELTVADVSQNGIIGDRAYAIIDNSTGKIASAKNPRKWARLFDCYASFVDPPRKNHPVPPVLIMLPDGSSGVMSRIRMRLSPVSLNEKSLWPRLLPSPRRLRNTGQTSTDSLIVKL